MKKLMITAAALCAAVGLNAVESVNIVGFKAVNDESNNNPSIGGLFIPVSGGSFYAKVSKSWACDSGYGTDSTSDAEMLANCVTVVGSPTTKSIAKKQVQIIF